MFTTHWRSCKRAQHTVSAVGWKKRLLTGEPGSDSFWEVWLLLWDAGLSLCCEASCDCNRSWLGRIFQARSAIRLTQLCADDASMSATCLAQKGGTMCLAASVAAHANEPLQLSVVSGSAEADPCRSIPAVVWQPAE